MTAFDGPLQEMFLPIHGYVRLYAEEVAVINHPTFQRLRKCRQLGFAHMVFPGAMHTRFEHSIGAVHVTDRIVENINLNCRNFEHKSKLPKANNNVDLVCRKIDDNVRKIVRLSALLHDIGHLPYGHSLEDELEHLDKHDASNRLDLVTNAQFGNFKWPDSIREKSGQNREWIKIKNSASLRQLVDLLYRKPLKELGLDTKLSPMRVVELVASKGPTSAVENGPEMTAWQADIALMEKVAPVQACRDIVGNTICADLLDYAYRDWYHLGRPLYEDLRLYQYMEIRAPVTEADDHSKWDFVINVGPEGNRRLDALTDILQLLETRYKLCETVLFHRTKLAMIALVDRCLIEIRRLYLELDLRADNLGEDLESPEEYLRHEAVDLLLRGSDDSLGEILKKLARGGRSKSNQEKVQNALRGKVQAKRRTSKPKKGKSAEVEVATLFEDDIADDSLTASSSLPFPSAGAVDRTKLIDDLIERIRHRQVYHELTNRRADEFPSMDVEHIVDWYKWPSDREALLHMIEHHCSLPSGSLLMYCPPDTRMNAKVAEVKVLIDGRIVELYTYEKENGSKEGTLTSGAVGAQLRRFQHLWKVRYFIHPDVWESLSEQRRITLVHIFKQLATPEKNGAAKGILRKSLEPLFNEFAGETKQAARGGHEMPIDSPILSDRTQLSNGVPFMFPE